VVGSLASLVVAPGCSELGGGCDIGPMAGVKWLVLTGSVVFAPVALQSGDLSYLLRELVLPAGPDLGSLCAVL